MGISNKENIRIQGRQAWSFKLKSNFQDSHIFHKNKFRYDKSWTINDSLALGSDLHFQLSDSPLESQELLLKSSLFALQRGDLLLDPTVLSLLEIEMPLPMFKSYVTFIPKFSPIHWTNSSSHRPSSWSEPTRECPSRFLRSAPPSCGYLAHSKCSLFGSMAFDSKSTSKVWSLPLSEAGLFPKLWPVSLKFPSWFDNPVLFISFLL